MALQTSDPSAAVITSVGSVGNGGTISSTTPVITGTADVGDIVSIYDGVRLLGTALVGVNGTWSFTPTVALKLGAHSFAAIPQDSHGNFGASSATVGVQIASNVPVAPVITNIVNASQVTIPSGGITNSGTETVSGTGVAGATVHLYENGYAFGSTTVDVTGHWTLTINLGGQGDHTYAMTATQTTGASPSVASNTWTLTLNTTTPATPAAPTTTDDSGNPIPAGSTTADAHPHIHGKGTNGDTITVYDNGVVIGSTTVAGDGTWTFTPSPDLPNGSNSITVIETNPAGTPSASSTPIVVVVDTTTPAKPSTPVLTDDSNASIPAGSTSSDGHPHISGTGTAGNIVKVYDGATPIGSAVVDGTGKWTFTPSTDMASGPHSISATQTNAAGTTGAASAAIAFTFTPVAGAPVITNVLDTVGTSPTLVSIPSGGATSGNQPTISGTGVVGDTVYIFQNGAGCGSTTVDTTGHWSVKVPAAMTDGAHIMTATQFASGQAQSVASNSWTITINTTTPATPAAPTLTDDSGHAIAAGSTTADAHPHIAGKGTTGDIIKVYDNGVVIGSTTVAGDGTWSFTPSPDLSNGSNSITVIETNPAGTSSATSAATAVVVDTTTPAKPSTPVLTDDSNASIPAGSTSSDGHPHISGTGTAGNIVKVYDGSTPIGSAVVDGTGKWTFTPSTDMASGTHTITATQTNAAGTTGAASAAIAFTFTPVAVAPVITSVVDAVGPVQGPVPNNGTTDDNQPTVGGTGTVGDTVYLFMDGVGAGQATVDATGHWALKPQWTINDGLHTFTATQFASGQAQSAASNSWTITITTTAPATPAAPTFTDDSGNAIAAGSTTTDAYPHINGHGTAGDTITVYDGAKVLGSTVVQSNGTWTFQPTTMLAANSTHSISVTESNAAGASAYSAASSVRIGAGLVITGVYDNSGLLIANNASSTGPLTVKGWVNGYTAGTQQLVLLVGGAASTIGSGNHLVFVTVNSDGTFAYTFSSQSKDTVGSPLFTGSPGTIDFTGTVIVVASGNAVMSSSTWTANETSWNYSAPLVSATQHAPVTDDTVVALDPTASTPAHHTVVGEHDAFIGTAANGNETVDLNADPASYFKETTAHIQGSGGTAIDTLHLTGDHQVLDLTSLTGQTAAAKISGIEVIDLGGHTNNLKLSLTDVLNLGEQDLFQKDGHQQLMVKGSDGDTVDLSNAHIAGVADGVWQAEGTAVVGGVTYNVYEHSGAHTELLVQQGVQIALHN
ncbi:Ig-like domain-containing protein [Caballeronia sp. LjRoot31]|uniref:beta strand repeat-containing protein n=1 Tax=Caballeronia sp. LjRoot31 TaxID=3342324 RepID=UPI003ECE7871